jgi:hypothetical protein
VGSGNSAGRAQREAERAEQERQARIAAGTARVNQVFDAPEREQQRGDFLTALRENYRRLADKQKGNADRNLRFSLARGGLTGGSAAVDSNRKLGEEYTEGLLNAETRAQGAVGELRGQDEASRLQLLSMIQQGLDATTGAARAGDAIRANAQAGQGAALSEGLGDIFGGTADIYKRQQEAAERRRGIGAGREQIYAPTTRSFS